MVWLPATAWIFIYRRNRQKTAPLKGRMNGGLWVKRGCFSRKEYLFTVHKIAPYLAIALRFGSTA